MIQPIELRGHHLDSIAGLYLVTLDEHIINLKNNGYILYADDSFVDFSYNHLKSLFENPAQQIKIIAEKPDIVCNLCRKIDSCFDEKKQPQPRKTVLGLVFNPEKIIHETSDFGVAEKYGFEIGRIYTSKEIRNRVGF